MRRRLITSTVILGTALCGFVIYYAQLNLASIPPPPYPLTKAETDTEPALQFHKVLTKAEKQHVLDGQFTLLTSIEGMPTSLKRAFTEITGEKQFGLANPGQKYQITDVIDEPGLPFRRLVFAGVSGDGKKWFVLYECGGIGHFYGVVMFRIEPEKRTQFLWGGVGSKRAKDLPDLRKSIADDRFCDRGLFYW